MRINKKTFNFISIIVLSVGGIVEAAAEFFSWGAAIKDSIPVITGAIITVLGNFVDNAIEDKSVKLEK